MNTAEEHERETMSKMKVAPGIPRRFTRRQTAYLWGKEYQVKPAVADSFLGDGRALLRFTPLNTRPDYYLIRVDSSWGKGEGWDAYEHLDEVIEALEEDFSEIERERGHLEEDIRESGIEPTGDNTDLAGNEDRLGWPVLSLDSGYGWGVVARYDGRKWVDER